MYEYNPIGNGPELPTLSKHVKKIPQPLAFSAGQHQEGLTAEEASDSGDSLFVTQRPVLDVVRSTRRRRHGKRSCLAYSRYLEESEAESSASSSSQEEPRTDKCSNRKKSCLPKYTFSFLPVNGPKDTALPAQKNRVLHTFAVAGFFKCLNGFSAKISLPTVGTDDEDISPLSESQVAGLCCYREEEEKSHVHGFRVVDKKCFATALKATSCQTWCNQRKQHENASCEKTDRQERTSRKHSKWKEKKTKAANIVREEYLESDVMITDSIISLEGGGKKKNNDDISHSEWSSTANGNFNGAEGVKIKHKENKKDKRVITADIHEESHSVTRQLEGSGNESQNSSTLEKVEELSYSQRQKHTKKQQSSDAPQAEEVVDGHDSRVAATLKERIGKSHKRKRKSIWDEEEVSNALENNIPTSEGFAGDQSAKPVKNPKTKVDASEDSVAQNNCSGEVQKKERTTSSFLCADAVEKDAQTPREHISFWAEVQDTKSAKSITNLEHSDYLVKKKKRKRKLGCKDAIDRCGKKKGQ
eukprot:XP_011615508.1 PREDICTED: aspartoacylase isoform X1 [Takifugu rubripes]